MRSSRLALSILLLAPVLHAEDRVRVVRLPEGALQPQARVDAKGALHVVYLQGAPDACDLVYLRSEDRGKTFSAPLRVNSRDGSAIAIGTIRGAQLALGREGRVHVVWNGSPKAARPPTDGDGGHAAAPLLYSRLDPVRGRFEEERDLLGKTRLLDGGGSVAADSHGRVHVVWHALPPDAEPGEGHRAVFVASSADDGESFAAARRATDRPTGACACCGLSAFATADGDVHVLFRKAERVLERDIVHLESTDRGKTFVARDLDPWRVPKCVMSLAAFCESSGEVLGAWETEEDVRFGVLAKDPVLRRPSIALGERRARKHPSIAANENGILLAWTEGSGWKRAGTLAWQRFSRDGTPLDATPTRGPELAVWSYPAAVAWVDGDFAIVH